MPSSRRRSGRGADRSAFLGSGGAAILMQPAAQLLARRSGIRSGCEISAELVLTGSPLVGPTTLAVIPSLSGTTRESIAALDHCLSKGARVLTLVGHADTPLGRHADALVNFAEDDTSSESFYLQSLLLALAVLDRRGEDAHWRETLAELRLLPELLVGVKKGYEPQAEALAATLARHPWHIVTGAGPLWPQAFYYGMCILEEMQWIRTRPVHASDFFHGTLELVEKGVSVVVMKGEDETRPLADRVERFAAAHTDILSVVDTASAPLPGISPRTRALVGPVVLATMLERVSAHVEAITGHPLTMRRYYRRIDY
jgi:fructoselysine-6-phosphate deglycase